MINRIFQEAFLKSWWVVLIILLILIFIEDGIKIHHREYAKLQQQFKDLEKQKKEALDLQEKLLLEINSQSDPAWVELVLMKGLGLVPEGQIKVYFDPSKVLQ